jgi:UDP-3-O-[3-hydroxymyristoyl] glucosamine N-acyltransferase
MSDERRFFPPLKPMRLAEVAAIAGAELVRGDGDELLSGIAPLEAAAPGDLTFLDNPKYLKHLADTKASACLCAKRYADRVPDGVAILETGQPYHAYATVLAHAFADAMRPAGAIGGPEYAVSPGAHVDPEARLEDEVRVEPGAVIGPGAAVGRHSVIAAGAVISANVSIGRECSIGSGVTLQHAILGDRVIIHPGCQIGQDGFGFAMSPAGHRKVPQVGRVIIQDDVEIGANTTVDRGANRDTIIGEGTKIDNQVQIGHNVVIGRHCVIVAQVGLSGSCRLGDFVAIGGQSGVNGHVTVGDGAQIAAVSSVHGDVPPGARWGGVPARPAREWFREVTILRKMAQRGGTDKSGKNGA